MRHILGYITALCLLTLIVCQSIIFPTFFLPFFRQQYASQERADYIGMSDEELMYVTVELLNYMRGRRDDMDGIRATVNGEEQEFFSERDKIHMVDVRVLYDRLFIVRNVAFFGFVGLVLLMAITKSPVRHLLARCSREVMAGFLLLSAILAGVIAIDFDRAFEIFHLIFFNNDYWILFPPRDRLVMMVPLQFFINISIFIGILWASLPIIVIIAATIYLRYEANRPGFGRYQ
ncbi:MAG: TIGR01906 family membrane protein [Defluviitaleaceae bacterium]|nr:TIGR01906 family membrane protein [Defluviitaleaceae bacterium]